MRVLFPAWVILTLSGPSPRDGWARAQEEVAAKGDFAVVAESLEPFLRHEVDDKSLPALSIALVVDQEIVWARGFGFTDAQRTKPATAETIYRVGSVSKLFTDIAAMQLVEQGKLDLDAPVSRWLVDFSPRNPSGEVISLRRLMSHRSGLLREPPVGHYFDDSGPSLAETVRSLNATTLVYTPGTRTKYSNAAIAVVGAIIESVQNEPFALSIKRTILDPLGLNRTTFDPASPLHRGRAEAIMWTYDGRTFPAPTFFLGTGPAGNLESSAIDLARFLSTLFREGQRGSAMILKPESLRAMLSPESGGAGGDSPFALGFGVGRLDNDRRVGHGGAIYGFSTELAALPDRKLGVVVLAAKDGCNGVTRRIADLALRAMRSVQQREPIASIPDTHRIEPDRARQLHGRYGPHETGIDLNGLGGFLSMTPQRGGFTLRLQSRGDALVVDDALAYGQTFQVSAEGQLIDGPLSLERQTGRRPEPPPSSWNGLIGEYGWDYNTLYILEKDGKLHALIEWFFLYPLENLGDDVFAFPSWGLYEGEKLFFKRDEGGRASKVVAASVTFPRRPIAAEGGAFPRIKPLRPIAQLTAEAQATTPPELGGDPNAPGLVDLATLDPTIKFDIRYAGPNNFLGEPVYASSRALMRRPAAEALLRVHRSLAEQGYGLLIHDAYRPWSVTKIFWEASPPESRSFVADPSLGSKHNRGGAVDLTLYHLDSGKPAEMVGSYDEFSTRSFPNYPGGTSLQRWQRDLLRRAMEAQGFTVDPGEWWHFNDKNWASYPVLNVPFESLTIEGLKGAH
jgi:CubicO group peptidase (beta-lactamase class C family)/D-alanyl-D-alanine dipeptidase